MAGASRRVGNETSATRARIVEATELLILEQGYSALSTRRVAARAGLKASLVHYYFPTTDDLLLEVSQKGAEESDRMIEEALASDDPLNALWAFYIDTSRTAVALEFMAMANHRDALRAHMAEHCRQMREREARLFRELFGEQLEARTGLSPEALSVVLVGIGRAIIMEENLGCDTGHDEAKAFVEGWLEKLGSESQDDG